MRIIPKYQTAWGKMPLILNDKGKEDWVAEHATELPEVTITAPKPLTDWQQRDKANGVRLGRVKDNSDNAYREWQANFHEGNETTKKFGEWGGDLAMGLASGLTMFNPASMYGYAAMGLGALPGNIDKIEQDIRDKNYLGAAADGTLTGMELLPAVQTSAPAVKTIGNVLRRVRYTPKKGRLNMGFDPTGFRLDLSEEAMAAREAELAKLMASKRRELHMPAGVREAYDKINNYEVDLKNAIQQTMHEVPTPEGMNTKWHSFNVWNGDKDFKFVHPSDVTGTYDWSLGKDFADFKKALAEDQGITPWRGLFDRFTRRFTVEPVTSVQTSVPTANYTGRNAGQNANIFISTDEPNIPLIFDRGNSRAGHFRWNDFNGFLKGFTKRLGMKAQRKGAYGFYDLSPAENDGAIYGLSNEAQAQLWNYLSTELKAPATVKQYNAFVDLVSKDPRFLSYIDKLHANKYLLRKNKGYLDPETIKNWLKLFGTTGAVSTIANQTDNNIEN